MTNAEASQVPNLDEKMEELKQSISRLFTLPYSVDLLRFECLSQLMSASTKGGPLDPRNAYQIFPARGFYQYVQERFRQFGLQEVAIQLFLQIWQEFQAMQKEETHYVYMAVVAEILSDIYHRSGDIAAAMRWTLLFAASDQLCMSIHEDLGTVRTRIGGRYALPEDVLPKLSRFVRPHQAILREDEHNRLLPEAFAEDVVTKFLAERQEYGVLFARHTPKVNEFPLSKVYFNSLLEKMDSVATTAKKGIEKGKPLEDLATYLMLLIPGWIPRRNVKTVYNEFESDIIVSNLIQAGNLNAELFGRNFLIECKNWEKPVGTEQVGYFLYRMRLTHTTFGILFASGGITGGKKKKKKQKKVRIAAESMIHRAFNEDGIICIWLDRKDLDNLRDEKTSFWAMIVEKARTVQFGRSMYKAYR